MKKTALRSVGDILSICILKTSIAGRPKAALLFWFVGGFRCGVPLFIVISLCCYILIQK